MSVAAKTIEASPPPPPRASRALAFWRNAIGKKALMAVTGIVLFLFVLVHMVANLQAFAGGRALDRYAEQLRVFPVLLWTARITLLVATVVHVTAGVQLWLGRHRARPERYRDYRAAVATPASRTMIWSGFLILGFVVYHLLDLTLGVANPDFRDGEVLHNLVVSLGRTAAGLFYVVAVAGLGVHLWHGLWSMFQSLGVSNRAFTPGLRRLAAVFGTVLAVGFAAVPIAVLLGVVR